MSPMFGAILFCVAAVVGGTALAARLFDRPVEQLAAGTAMGFLVGGLAGFVAASLFGMSNFALLIAGAAPLAGLYRSRIPRFDRPAAPTLICIVALVLFLGLMAQ